MLIPTALFALLAITPDFVFVLFFTKKFLPTAAISRFMALPYLIYPLLSLAHLFLLYTVKKPSRILLTNIIPFLTITVGCYLFIPKYGIAAAIYSIGAGYILSCAFLAAIAWREFKQLP
jgi:O-antigen/teichoic acid export membrane protein